MISEKCKSASITSLKLRQLTASLSWKNILNGQLEIELDGIEIVAKLNDKDGEGTIWFDALSESMYQALSSFGDLDSFLDGQVEQVIEEDSETVRELSKEQNFDSYKALLKNIIRKVSLIARNLEAKLSTISDDYFALSCEMIRIEDTTENSKSEISHDEECMLYASKRIELGVTTLSASVLEKYINIMTLKPGEMLIINVKITVDCSLEIEGYLSGMQLCLTPLSIKHIFSVLGSSSNTKDYPKISHSSPFAVAFAIIKLNQVDIVFRDDHWPSEQYYRVSLSDMTLKKRIDNEGIFLNELSALQMAYYHCNNVHWNSESEEPLRVHVRENSIVIKLNESPKLTISDDLSRLVQNFIRCLASQKRNVEHGNRNKITFEFELTGIQLRSDSITNSLLIVENILIFKSGESISSSFNSAELVILNSRAKIKATTVAYKYNEIPAIFEPMNPFSDLNTILEDERLLNGTSPENAQRLRENLQTSSHNILSLSNRGITIQLDGEDLHSLISYIQLFSAGSGESGNLDRFFFSGCCSSVAVELKLAATIWKIELSGSTIFGAKNHSSHQSLMDVRTDVNSLLRDEISIMQSYLTLSLDNQARHFVMTVDVSQTGERRCALELAGIHLDIPIGERFDTELNFLMSCLGEFSKKETTWITSMQQLAMKKCSFTFKFPKSWPKCYPSAIFIEHIRVIPKSDCELKMFLIDTMLLLAKRKIRPENPGIYEEGLTYWQEHGYRAVGKANFLQASVVRGHPIEIFLESQDVEIELREDSVHVAKHFFEYLSNISRYTSEPSGEEKCSPGVKMSVSDQILEGVNERMFETFNLNEEDIPAFSEANLMKDVDEDFFGGREASDNQDYWNAVAIASSSLPTALETLVLSAEGKTNAAVMIHFS